MSDEYTIEYRHVVHGKVLTNYKLVGGTVSVTMATLPDDPPLTDEQIVASLRKAQVYMAANRGRLRKAAEEEDAAWRASKGKADGQ